ncbi:MAG: GNAT family N-acetyltransferase [Chthoniobacteraceae bacterium]
MIALASSNEEIAACFPVMHELRPHLKAEEFVKTVHALQFDGYALAYVATPQQVVAVAGYRIKHNLMRGTFLYVDDLVTLSTERQKGHAAELFAWLVAKAQELRASELVLDSGHQRTAAHAFYEKHGMKFSARHYTMPLK